MAYSVGAPLAQRLWLVGSSGAFDGRQHYGVPTQDRAAYRSATAKLRSGTGGVVLVGSYRTGKTTMLKSIGHLYSNEGYAVV